MYVFFTLNKVCIPLHLFIQPGIKAFTGDAVNAFTSTKSEPSEFIILQKFINSFSAAAKHFLYFCYRIGSLLNQIGMNIQVAIFFHCAHSFTTNTFFLLLQIVVADCLRLMKE